MFQTASESCCAPHLEVAGDDWLSNLDKLTHLKYFSTAFMEYPLCTYMHTYVTLYQYFSEF